MMGSKRVDEMHLILTRVVHDSSVLGMEVRRYLADIDAGGRSTKWNLVPVEFALHFVPVLMYQNLLEWHRDAGYIYRYKSYSLLFAAALLCYYEENRR